jgi:hypothetical protein
LGTRRRIGVERQRDQRHQEKCQPSPLAVTVESMQHVRVPFCLPGIITDWSDPA